MSFFIYRLAMLSMLSKLSKLSKFSRVHVRVVEMFGISSEVDLLGNRTVEISEDLRGNLPVVRGEDLLGKGTEVLSEDFRTCISSDKIVKGVKPEDYINIEDFVAMQRFLLPKTIFNKYKFKISSVRFLTGREPKNISVGNPMNISVGNPNFFLDLRFMSLILKDGLYEVVLMMYSRQKGVYVVILKDLFRFKTFRANVISKIYKDFSNKLWMFGCEELKIDLGVPVLVKVKVKMLDEGVNLMDKGVNLRDEEVLLQSSMLMPGLFNKLKPGLFNVRFFKALPFEECEVPSELTSESNERRVLTVLTVYKEIEILKVKLDGLSSEALRINRLGFVVYRDFIRSRGDYPELFKKMSRYFKEVTTGKEENRMTFEDLTDSDLLFLIKWSYQALLMDLLLGYNELMFRLKIELKITDGVSFKRFLDNDDLLVTVIEDIKGVYEKIDPSLRVKLQKRGIVLLRNIYTGFDTEYINKTMSTNELLSVQLAVSTRLIVQVPIRTPYKIEKVHSLSGDKFEVEKAKNLKARITLPINVTLIEEDLESIIEGVRLLTLESYDSSTKLVCECLTSLPSVQIVEVKDRDVLNFILDKSMVTTWFKFTNEYSLRDIVKKSKDLGDLKLEKSTSEILMFLRDYFKTKKYSSLLNSIPVGDYAPSPSPSPSPSILNGDGEGVGKGSLEFEYKDLFGKRKNFDELDIDNILDEEEEEEETEERVLHEEVEAEDSVRTYYRTSFTSFSEEKVNVTVRKNVYLIGFFLHADLSMLKDFGFFKDKLSIINRCMVTLKSIDICGVKLIMRDAMLIGPAGGSLASLGALYGNRYKKLHIGDWITRMENLKEVDPAKFIAYGLQDAIIPLIHGLSMEEYNHKLGKLGIPLTISQLAKNYVLKKWDDDSYKGYQISPLALVGNVQGTFVPKVLRTVDSSILQLGLYIMNYRGGRNECFMYGVEYKSLWYDYDLISAYTTAMSIMGDPDYKAGVQLTAEAVIGMSDENLIKSYTIIRGRFSFMADEKFPSIPVRADENIDVYPLNGDCVISGPEYVLARNQGCYVKIDFAFTIPFRTEEVADEAAGGNKTKIQMAYKPFLNIMQEIQSERRKYPKKTFKNELEKLKGNACYGLVSTGIGGVKKFDVQTGTMQLMQSNELSNPILASWITSYVRSVIGELLVNTHKLGGRLVSVTTDGFLTDKKDLESSILNSRNVTVKTPLLKTYADVREELCGNRTCLETKHDEIKGIISWATMGQYSLDDKIAASTGLQKKSFEKEMLKDLLEKTIKSYESRSFGFVQTRLTGALEVYREEKHVVSLKADRLFSMYSDNRRHYEGDTLEGFFDSVPMRTASECVLSRFVAGMWKRKLYNKTTPIQTYTTKYKSTLDLAVRKFVRAIFSEEFGLSKETFRNYKEMSEFLNKFPGVSLKVNTIAQLKRRPLPWVKLDFTDEVKDFLSFIKYSGKFPGFDEGTFVGVDEGTFVGVDLKRISELKVVDDKNVDVDVDVDVDDKNVGAIEDQDLLVDNDVDVDEDLLEDKDIKDKEVKKLFYVKKGILKEYDSIEVMENAIKKEKKKSLNSKSGNLKSDLENVLERKQWLDKELVEVIKKDIVDKQKELDIVNIRLNTLEERLKVTKKNITKKKKKNTKKKNTNKFTNKFTKKGKGGDV